MSTQNTTKRKFYRYLQRKFCIIERLSWSETSLRQSNKSHFESVTCQSPLMFRLCTILTLAFWKKHFISAKPMTSDGLRKVVKEEWKSGNIKQSSFIIEIPMQSWIPEAKLSDWTFKRNSLNILNIYKTAPKVF